LRWWPGNPPVKPGPAATSFTPSRTEKQRVNDASGHEVNSRRGKQARLANVEIHNDPLVAYRFS